MVLAGSTLPHTTVIVSPMSSGPYKKPAKIIPTYYHIIHFKRFFLLTKRHTFLHF